MSNVKRRRTHEQFLEEVDDRKFEHDNGINALMDLAGNDLFGHVELDKVERSETANLASKL